MQVGRYQRHSLIDWFDQDKVKRSYFAIIGCGAVGNEVAKNLALLGVGKLDLFDFDTIEIHNLTRSVLFRESDVGLNKAEVAAKRLKELDPSLEISVFPGDFWELLPINQVKAYDSVICCVDNFEARIKLNDLCLISGTNLINTGIDSKFSQVEVFPYKSGKHVACYECNLPISAYERMHQRYSCGWLKKISYVEKKIPTTIVTSSLTGSLATANALNLIRTESQNESIRILTDTFTGRSTVSIIEQNADCPACASMNDQVSLLRGSSLINSKFNDFPGHDIHIRTSEPILVSARCNQCTQDSDRDELIFEKASDFDSSIATCDICKQDSVEVVIKDVFSVNELLSGFLGKRIPTKYIRIDTENQTTIIELETN